MIEPSDTERAELPETSAQYMVDLEDRLEELETALVQIREYAKQIPLHTEDAHVRHFTNQIVAWATAEIGETPRG